MLEIKLHTMNFIEISVYFVIWKEKKNSDCQISFKSALDPVSNGPEPHLWFLLVIKQIKRGSNSTTHNWPVPRLASLVDRPGRRGRWSAPAWRSGSRVLVSPLQNKHVLLRSRVQAPLTVEQGRNGALMVWQTLSILSKYLRFSFLFGSFWWLKGVAE